MSKPKVKVSLEEYVSRVNALLEAADVVSYVYVQHGQRRSYIDDLNKAIAMAMHVTPVTSIPEGMILVSEDEYRDMERSLAHRRKVLQGRTERNNELMRENHDLKNEVALLRRQLYGVGEFDEQHVVYPDGVEIGDGCYRVKPKTRCE